MLWNRLRPWLGVGFFLFEAVQPLLGHPVEPLIVGGAVSMMAIELLSRADKEKDHNGEPK